MAWDGFLKGKDICFEQEVFSKGPAALRHSSPCLQLYLILGCKLTYSTWPCRSRRSDDLFDPISPRQIKAIGHENSVSVCLWAKAEADSAKY
jgi:hypothetical protein